jgi:hypothetical protein
MPEHQEPDQEFAFEGFDSPRYTVVPDQLFDELLNVLSDAELRVVLYITRRTFGFKKDHDDISLRQMTEGIQLRDGRRLDGGCGLSKSGVAKAIRGLTAKGIITTRRNSSLERGNEPTTYALRFKGDPLSTTWTRGSAPGGQARVYKVDTQDTVEQHTEIQDTESSKEDSTGKNNDLFTRRIKSNRGLSGGDKPVSAANADVLQRSEPSDPSRAPSQLTALNDVLDHRILGSAPTSPASVETPPVPEKPRRGRPPKASEQIVFWIEKYSGEFHDEDHVPSNISQAARLWKDSGVEESVFCSILVESAARTKQAGNIQKRAGGKDGELGYRNKMPYFFACVRDRLFPSNDRHSSPSEEPAQP